MTKAKQTNNEDDFGRWQLISAWKFVSLDLKSALSVESECFLWGRILQNLISEHPKVLKDETQETYEDSECCI